MSQEISTEIMIAALPERVWEVLTDFAAYAAWNPFIIGIEGAAQAGERLKATIRPPGGNAQVFRPIVLQADAPEAFVWRGSLPIPGIFTGVHAFRLTREGDATRLHQGETFSGLLVPFVAKTLAQTEEGFNQMNAALKLRVEAGQ
jgi:hypothetical protein